MEVGAAVAAVAPLDAELFFDPLEPAEDVLKDRLVDNPFVAVEEPFPVDTGLLGYELEGVDRPCLSAFPGADGVAVGVDRGAERFLAAVAGLFAGLADPAAHGFLVDRRHPEGQATPEGGRCLPRMGVKRAGSGMQLHTGAVQLRLRGVQTQAREMA